MLFILRPKKCPQKQAAWERTCTCLLSQTRSPALSLCREAFISPCSKPECPWVTVLFIPSQIYDTLSMSWLQKAVEFMSLSHPFLMHRVQGMNLTDSYSQCKYNSPLGTCCNPKTCKDAKSSIPASRLIGSAAYFSMANWVWCYQRMRFMLRTRLHTKEPASEMHIHSHSLTPPRNLSSPHCSHPTPLWK